MFPRRSLDLEGHNSSDTEEDSDHGHGSCPQSEEALSCAPCVPSGRRESGKISSSWVSLHLARLTTAAWKNWFN